MQHDQVIRRNIRRNPQVIEAARPSALSSAFEAGVVISGIIGVFYSLILSGLL